MSLAEIKTKGLRWIDIVNPTKGEIEFLRNKIPLKETVAKVKDLDTLYPGKLIAPKDFAVQDKNIERKEISIPTVPTEKPIFPLFEVGDLRVMFEWYKSLKE